MIILITSSYISLIYNLSYKLLIILPRIYSDFLNLYAYIYKVNTINSNF